MPLLRKLGQDGQGGFEVSDIFGDVPVGGFQRYGETLGRLPNSEKVEFTKQLDDHKALSTGGFTPSIRA